MSDRVALTHALTASCLDYYNVAFEIAFENYLETSDGLESCSLEVFYTAAFKALYNSVAWAPTVVTTVSKRFESCSVEDLLDEDTYLLVAAVFNSNGPALPHTERLPQK